MFFDKIGKSQTRFLTGYLIHLVLVHCCFAITYLAHHKMNVSLVASKLLCNSFIYLSYYSLIACFFWLCILCYNIRHSLKLHQNAGNEDILQISRRRKKIKEFCLYCLIALGIPVIITVAVSYADKFYSVTESYYCLRLQATTEENYVVCPIVVIMVVLLIFIAQARTKICGAKKAIVTLDQNLKKLEKETRRLAVVFAMIFDYNLCLFTDLWYIQGFHLSCWYHGASTFWLSPSHITS